MVALYGSNLAYTTDSASPQNIRDNLLPVRLHAGVQVLMMWGKLGIPMPLQMVSPTQVNFVLPASADPGLVHIAVVRDGIYGPVVPVELQEAAPALVEAPAESAVASHPDGRLITAEDPAVPGEWVILHATGLGPTVLRLRDGEIPMVPPLPLAGLGNQAAAAIYRCCSTANPWTLRASAMPASPQASRRSMRSGCGCPNTSAPILKFASPSETSSAPKACACRCALPLPLRRRTLSPIRFRLPNSFHSRYPPRNFLRAGRV